MGDSAKWYLELGGKVFEGMGAQTNSIFHEFFEANELEGPATFMVQVAHGYDPEPITAKLFFQRGFYGERTAFKKRMQKVAEDGWLKPVGEGQYRLTEKGQETAAKLFKLIDRTYGNLETLPADDLERIIALLGKVVDKAKALPDPAEKWAFAWGEKFDRGPDASLVLQLRRRMIDLFGYRDDSHVAAWMAVEPNGQLWETLTYVWNEEAHTAAELSEKLSEHRNFDEQSYAAALDELAGRGWLNATDGKYVVTEKGKKLRQEAENTTDRYYDAPWKVLSKEETVELKGLLEKLAEAVKVEKEEAEES